MTFGLLSELVTEHADRLAHMDALGGGRGDGGKYKLLQELDTVKQQLIIIHDLRPSEFDTKLLQIDIGEGAGFKEVIDAAKLELIKDMSYEELKKWIKVV